jgi:hypothetical protein
MPFIPRLKSLGFSGILINFKYQSRMTKTL